MSTYLYLQCLSHTPPLQAEAESGQHLYDLPQIRADIADRERIAAAVNDQSSGEWWGDAPEFTHDYFRRTSARFLATHPACQIGIVDECGGRYNPTEADEVTPVTPAGMAPVLTAVMDERIRQHRLYGDQSHLPDGTGDQLARLTADNRRRECDLAQQEGQLTWRHILAEEAAEAMAEADPARLRAELIQVAAVCVQWVQAIDGRG